MSARQVLIVEDHPLFVQAVSELVARLDRNAQLRSAHTLADALAAVEGGWWPDFVLLDLNLPDVVGLEGVRKLRLPRIFPRSVSRPHWPGARSPCSHLAKRGTSPGSDMPSR